jgi:hypothetical protein
VAAVELVVLPRVARLDLAENALDPERAERPHEQMNMVREAREAEHGELKLRAVVNQRDAEEIESALPREERLSRVRIEGDGGEPFAVVVGRSRCHRRLLSTDFTVSHR